MTTRTIYVGSYTPDSSGNGTGVGITRLAADTETGRLTIAGRPTPVCGPSFLARHPDGTHLYSVVERPDGAVHAFAVDDRGELTSLGEQPTGGADPCHLCVDPTGQWLVTANYTSGSVSVHPIEADGGLGEATALIQHSGTGPVADRQAGPHAHQAHFDPAGRYLLVNDLGADRITAYTLHDGTLRVANVTDVPAGTGPRHLAFGTDGRAHLAGELGSDVSTFAYHADSGALSATGRTDASGRGVSPNYPSGLVCSPDGAHLHVANRGANTIATFSAGGDELTLAGEVDTGGDWPRDLLLLGDFLYVANQNSHTIGIFRADPLPTPVGTFDIDSPACLLPLG